MQSSTDGLSNRRGPKSKLRIKDIYVIRREIILVKNAGKRINSTRNGKEYNLNISKTKYHCRMNNIGYK